MRFNIVSSGSKGNATLVYDGNTLILIDMGVSLSRLEEGLKEISKSVSDIDAIFFTHDHTDHIGQASKLDKSKFHTLRGTIGCDENNYLEMFKPCKIKGMTIYTIPTSHDATNPCGFFIESENETLAYITDTGYVLEETKEFIHNPDYLILECNHDIQMLLKTDRPPVLKNRILSNKGHLCNEDSAIAAVDIIGPKTKEIVLAHISEEANEPSCALKAYERIFSHFGINIHNYKVQVANQHHSTFGGNDAD